MLSSVISCAKVSSLACSVLFLNHLFQITNCCCYCAINHICCCCFFVFLFFFCYCKDLEECYRSELALCGCHCNHGQLFVALCLHCAGRRVEQDPAAFSQSKTYPVGIGFTTWSVFAWNTSHYLYISVSLACVCFRFRVFMATNWPHSHGKFCGSVFITFSHISRYAPENKWQNLTCLQKETKRLCFCVYLSNKPVPLTAH